MKDDMKGWTIKKLDLYKAAHERSNIPGSMNRVNNAREVLAAKHLQNTDFDQAIEHLKALHTSEYTCQNQELKDALSNIYKKPELIEALIASAKKDKANALAYVAVFDELKIPIKTLLENQYIYDVLKGSIESIKESVRGDLLTRAIELSDKATINSLVDQRLTIKNTHLSAFIDKKIEITSKIIKQVSGDISLDILEKAMKEKISRAEFKALITGIAANDLSNALERAVLSNNVDLQIALIDKGVDPNKLIAGGKTLLIIAIEQGDEATIKNLLTSGANTHIQEKKLNMALRGASTGIQSLLAEYTEIEKRLKKEVLPKIQDMAITLDKKSKITDQYVMKELNTILDGVYGANEYLAGPVDKRVKLSLVGDLILSIKSFFRSFLDKKSYNTIKFEKMAERIYEKIQETPEFKALVAPAISSTLVASQTNLVEPKENVIIPEPAPVPAPEPEPEPEREPEREPVPVPEQNVTEPERDGEIIASLTKQFGRMLFYTAMSTNPINPEDIKYKAEMLASTIVTERIKGRGTKFSNEVVEDIVHSIDTKVEKAVSLGLDALNKSIENLCEESKVSKVQMHAEQTDSSLDELTSNVIARANFSGMIKLIKDIVIDVDKAAESKERPSKERLEKLKFDLTTKKLNNKNTAPKFTGTGLTVKPIWSNFENKEPNDTPPFSER